MKSLILATLLLIFSSSAYADLVTREKTITYLHNQLTPKAIVTCDSPDCMVATLKLNMINKLSQEQLGPSCNLLYLQYGKGVLMPQGFSSMIVVDTLDNFMCSSKLNY